MKNGDLKRFYQITKPVPFDFVRLNKDGKLPDELLPQYVDDVLEGYLHELEFYKTRTGTGTDVDPYVYTDKLTPEKGKIYVELSTNYLYHWDGSSYVQVGGGGAAGLVIQANNTTQVSGWDAPDLTVEQITQAYNYLVAGGSVTIQSEDGDVQFKAVLGDASTDRPSVVMQYYWLGWVDYQIAADEETISLIAHKIPEEPVHQITSVTIGADTIDVVIS